MASATKAPTPAASNVAINQNLLRQHAAYGMQQHLDYLNAQFGALCAQVGFPRTGRITPDMLGTSPGNTQRAGQQQQQLQTGAGAAGTGMPVRRKISAATRKKQSQVQKARWAAIRAGQVLPAGKSKARAA